jgi:DNA-binding CsgD family transcriptional regulator
MAAPGASAAYGGRLAADAAVGAAEVTRARGPADLESWRAAVTAADASGVAWQMAYTRYRLGEASLKVRAARREAADVLGDARARAASLSAAPLIDWIDSLARRSRLALPDARAADEEPATETTAPGIGLTRREREVLALLVEGHTNRRIADELFISESTAGVHVSNILGKLGVSTRTEAATVATRLGLVG